MKYYTINILGINAYSRRPRDDIHIN